MNERSNPNGNGLTEEFSFPYDHGEFVIASNTQLPKASLKFHDGISCDLFGSKFRCRSRERAGRFLMQAGAFLERQRKAQFDITAEAMLIFLKQLGGFSLDLRKLSMLAARGNPHIGKLSRVSGRVAHGYGYICCTICLPGVSGLMSLSGWLKSLAFRRSESSSCRRMPASRNYCRNVWHMPLLDSGWSLSCLKGQSMLGAILHGSMRGEVC
jgi:hypothetical protein